MTNQEYGLKLDCLAYLNELYKGHDISLDIKVSKKNCIVIIDGKKELVKIDWIKNWLDQK